MTLLINGKSNIIYKTIISIESLGYDGKEIMDRLSILFHKELSFVIKENIEKLEHVGNDNLFIEKLTVNLGSIDITLFETEIPRRLERELKKILKKYGHSVEHNMSKKIHSFSSIKETMVKYADHKNDNASLSLSHYHKKQSQKTANNMTDSIFYESSLIKEIDYYLHKGSWLSDKNGHYATNMAHVDNDVWQQIIHKPQHWLPMLAKHCLQPAARNRLIQICHPELLDRLSRLFSKTIISDINSSVQTIPRAAMAAEKLSIAAKNYLYHQTFNTDIKQPTKTGGILNNSTSTDHISQDNQHSLKPEYDKNDMQTKVGQLFLQLNKAPTTLLSQSGKSTETLLSQSDKDSPALLSQLNKAPTTLLSQKGKSSETLLSQSNNAPPTLLAQSVLSVTNAGCIVLWPLLPTFFRTFGLLDQNQFITPEAQREAVCLLDWLIWSEDEIPEWRLTLNKLLCGLSIQDNARWHTPKPEQQIAISQWLEKIIQQLPGWKKMGINDARYLFLQRGGEVSELNGLINIQIKSEIYDALLSEWLWPMNIASFSWLKNPITIEWL
ncbi:hypothetical protein Xsto_01017 [Xenorhabdus stockiae]|uniref:Uncharacterized protein n=1 Tax=Xenorhabdus stockiae TaxID=351614 RepID=A0A2D0KTI9_9GAMM|nr:contractile injection system tape measure protein [Xenorhabdus stockiae]PHM66688.1 hypothetical protein Xsto_01017 [Xenorhabdus stockiae]